MAEENLFPRGSGRELPSVKGKRSKEGPDKDTKAPKRKETEKDYLFSVQPSEKKQKAGVPAFKGGATTQTAVELGAGVVIPSRPGKAAKLELISFKRLNKGTLVLGIIHRIDQDDLIISLPSSLTGIVRRAEISDHLYTLSKAGAQNSKKRYFEADTTGPLPLQSIFTEGQIVRCAVKSVTEKPGGQAGQRHIELSLRASVVNKGASFEQFQVGSPASGSISSIEDHGYVVSLGLEGVSAFLLNADVHPAGSKLVVGQLVECAVKSVKAAARTLMLTNQHKAVVSARPGGSTSGGGGNGPINLRGLKPGMLVSGLVAAQMPNGVLVSFMGYFVGGLDHNHMSQLAAHGENGWRSKLPIGTAVDARILMLDYAAKAIHLTQRSHLMALEAPKDLPAVGTHVTDAQVLRVDGGLGLLLRLPRDNDEEVDSGIGAYVHISRVSDDRAEHLEKTFKPEQTVSCRVIGSSLVEGWATATLKQSALKAAVLSYADITPGQIVEGEVLSIESFGLFISLGEGVRGLCTTMHIIDAATVKKTKNRHKVGAKVSCRVLQVDPKNRRLFLTLKKSMLKDETEPITDYSKATKGKTAIGFITKITSAGVVVTFYNNVHGFVSAKLLAKQGVQDISESFTMGQTLKVVVLKSDPSATPPQLLLSVDVSGELVGGNDDKSGEGGERKKCPHEIGTLVPGKVIGVTDTSLRVLLEGYDVPAELPMSHSCDHAIYGPAIASTLLVGTELPGVLITEINSKTGVPSVSLKPLLLTTIENSKNNTVESSGDNASIVNMNMDIYPSATSQLTPGTNAVGVVARVEDYGVFVRFLGGLTTLCPRALVADQFVKDATGLFNEGDSVRCTIQRLDPATGRAVATFKRTIVPPSPGGLFLRTALEENVTAEKSSAEQEEHTRPVPNFEKYPVGCVRSAKVSKVGDYGALLTGDGDESAMLCALTEGDSQETQDLIKGLSVDDKVKVRVLSYDPSLRLQEVSVTPAFLKPPRANKSKARATRANTSTEETSGTFPEPGTKVKFTIAQAKPGASHAVAVLEGGWLGLISIADYHCPTRKVEDASGSGALPEVGASSTATVCGAMTPKGPYSGVVLLSPGEDKAGVTARKRRVAVQEDEDETRKISSQTALRTAQNKARKALPHIHRKDLVVGTCVQGSVTRVSTDYVSLKLKLARGSKYGEKKEGVKEGKKGEKDEEGLGEQEEEGSEEEGSGEESSEEEGSDVEVEVEDADVSGEENSGEGSGEDSDPMDTDIIVTRSMKKGEKNAKNSKKKQDIVVEEPKKKKSKTSTSSETPAEADEMNEDSKKRSKKDWKKGSENGDKKTRKPKKKSKKKKNKAETMSEGKKIVCRLHITDCDIHCVGGGTEEAEKLIAQHHVLDSGGLPVWHPFHKIHERDIVSGTIVSVQETDDCIFVGISQKEGEVRDKEGGVTKSKKKKTEKAPETVPHSRLDWDDEKGNLPEQGVTYRGIISAMAPNGAGCWVTLSPTVRGFASLIAMTEDTDVLADPLKRFAVGMSVSATVLKCDTRTKKLQLSFIAPKPETVIEPPPTARKTRKSSAAAVTNTSAVSDAKSDNFSPGGVVMGVVNLHKKVTRRPPGVAIDLPGGKTGRVCITEITDIEEWKDDLHTSLSNGSVVRCVVLPADSTARESSADASRTDTNVVELSLRPSRLHAATEKNVKQAIDKTEPNLSIGGLVSGFVTSMSRAGCFVRLSGGVTGRVLLKDLADHYVANPEEIFAIGKLVAGRVLSCTKDSAGNVSTLSLSLKPSVVASDGTYVTYETIRKGARMSGTVKSVTPFGVFIELDNSAVRGMCHKSEASDQKIEDITKVYAVGDYVKAIVLKVDADKKRVSLGLKASYFAGYASSSESSDSESDGSEESDDDDTIEPVLDLSAAEKSRSKKVPKKVVEKEPVAEKSEKKSKKKQKKEEVSEEEGDEGDDVTKEQPEEAQNGAAESSEESSENDAEESSEENSDEEEENSGGVFGSSLSGLGGMGYSMFDDFGGSGTSVPAEGGDSEGSDDEGSENDAEEQSAGKKKHSARKRAAERKAEEKRLWESEQSKLTDADAAPESVADFERLLVANPNSSYLWLKYMAFQLGLADIDGARAVAERALKKIVFREEQERLNVWVARMNLEVKYGSADELKSVVDRACKNANPKHVLLKLAEAHERSAQFAMCDAALALAVQRYKSSKKVWIAHMLFRLSQGEAAEARELLRRSLQSLSKHKHVAVICRFAQAEFSNGDAVRGREIFEALLGSYPKRLDLWNVYVDMEVKGGDLDAARSLFGRLCTQELGARRMKSVFKKFLTFEQKHGTPAQIAAVKEKALAYVQSLAE